VTIELECKATCRIIDSLIEISRDMSDGLRTQTSTMQLNCLSHNVHFATALNASNNINSFSEDPYDKIRYDTETALTNLTGSASLV